MSALPIPVNNPLKFTVTFVDNAGVAIDPVSALQIRVTDPAGVTTPYAYPGPVTRDDTGVYSLTIEGDQAGDWRARGQGVLSSGFLVTSGDVKRRLDASLVG